MAAISYLHFQAAYYILGYSCKWYFPYGRLSSCHYISVMHGPIIIIFVYCRTMNIIPPCIKALILCHPRLTLL